MKHIFPILLLLIVFASCSPPEPVEIPDPNLAARVRIYLGLDGNQPFYEKDLKKIKKFMLSTIK